jgi:hypothetical protein
MVLPGYRKNLIGLPERIFVHWPKPHIIRMAEMISPSIHEQKEHWQDFYRAALFEPNKSKLPVRIEHAEKQIAARARELFNTGTENIPERNALNVALFALQALRISLDWDTRGREPKSHRAVA